MADYRCATDAPRDWGTPGHRFLFGPWGHRHPIVGTSRRSVVIAYGPRRLRLRRRHLERHGVAVAAGIPFYISRYYAPGHRAA